MNLGNVGKLVVFLLGMLCSSPVLLIGQCVDCTCSQGVCNCPICHDQYPGYCAGLGCQDGFSCCLTHSTCKCYCVECIPTRCLAKYNYCTTEGCPFSPDAVEDIDANDHLQPWMVDKTLPSQLAAYSKTWSAIVARLQHDFSDSTEPLASRRKLLLPEIDHLELGLPEYKQSIVVATRYSAQKGVWYFRLVRRLNGDQSRADILIITPQKWWLRREEPDEHIGSGKIAPMPHVLDFP